jgi:hypothetical protein
MGADGTREASWHVDWFMDLVGHYPDGLILLIGAATTAVIAIVLAAVSRALFFATGSDRLGAHAKLAEIVHSSLLAFAVFVLALVLSDARSNMSKADDAVLREAATLERLDWELELIGGDAAAAARKQLREYATAIVDLDWPELGKPRPGLSRQAGQELTDLVVSVRAVAASRPEMAGTLSAMLDRLHEFRHDRLAGATKAVPSIFWWLIAAFLVGAMFLNGRHALDLASVSLITLHMAAIGLVIAFILIMDEPFRGEASIPPHPIARLFEASSLP